MSSENEHISVMGRIGRDCFTLDEDEVDGDLVTVTTPEGEEVKLPYDMLELFVARRVRRQKIKLFRGLHPRDALFKSP